MNDRVEIMNGSQLIVREGQVALFVKEGKLADIFAPGRYKLNTPNLPILTTLMNWNKGFNSPFKCDVFFVNTTQFTGQKWGTANPFTMRDPEFGVIRIRGFGTYNFKVTDPKMLLLELLGARNEFTVANIREKLRSLITSSISDIIANSKYSAIDLSTKLKDFNAIARDALQPKFNNIGMQLTVFVVENISFPEEVERAIDSRSSVGILNDKMGSFVAMQQAQAMRDMSNNPAGFGGAMMGLGMMGNMGGGMAMNNVQDTNQGSGLATSPQAKSPAAAAPAAGGNFCKKCGTAISPGAKFCGGCGKKLDVIPSCSNCKIELKPGAKFCSGCGTKQ